MYDNSEKAYLCLIFNLILLSRLFFSLYYTGHNKIPIVYNLYPIHLTCVTSVQNLILNDIGL